MKKSFKGVCLALAILCMGGVTTSCDSESLTQVLTTILGNLFNTGETYTFTGTGTSQALTGSINSGKWTYINSSTSNSTGTSNLSSATVSLTCNTTANLTLPAYTDGKVSVGSITLYNLTMSTNSAQTLTTLSIGDNSSIDGSITVDGVTYTGYTVYLGKAEATSESINLEMTLYFQGASDGEDCSKAINLTYTGIGTSTTAQ